MEILYLLVPFMVSIFAITYIFVALGRMKCMQKAGEKGWKAFVPVYSSYIMYKIVGMSGFSIIPEVISLIIVSIISIMSVSYISKAIEICDDNNTYSTDGTYSMSKKQEKEMNDLIEEFTMKATILSLISNLVGIASFVITILFAVNISKVFGKGGGYIAGMILVPQVFIMILGFGDATYQGSYTVKKEGTDF